MHDVRDTGKIITMVGAILFLLAVAALSFSLYGEVLDRTKSAVLMACATLSAFLLSLGRYLQSAEARSNRHRPPVRKNIVDS